MPVHDWTLVDAGTFHDFHGSWIQTLRAKLNQGVLPEAFYAQTEQYYTPEEGRRKEADVLALQIAEWEPLQNAGPAVAVATEPPQADLRTLSGPLPDRQRQRKVIIRRASNHRIVAWIELISPANKDRDAHVLGFAEKIAFAFQSGLHGLLLDILPPGDYDPHGMHGAVWEFVTGTSFDVPPERPLTLASYQVKSEVEAFVRSTGPGRILPDMALFVDEGWYVKVPLEATYMEAFAAIPRFWQDVLEGRAASPS